MEIVQDKWKEILQRVRDEHELSEISFTTWIEPLTIHSVEDNLITILVPSEKMGLACSRPEKSLCAEPESKVYL